MHDVTTATGRRANSEARQAEQYDRLAGIVGEDVASELLGDCDDVHALSLLSRSELESAIVDMHRAARVRSERPND